MRRPPRIFIGLTEVSGYYARLAKGFRELGIEAEFFPLQEHRFGYWSQAHISHPLARFARLCVVRRLAAIAEGGVLSRSFWLLMAVVSRIPLFVWVLFRFDAFLLGGGSSFFRFYELPLLRICGKRVVYTFHGTDSRPAYLDGFSRYVMSGKSEPTARDYVRLSRTRRRDVQFVERYVDVVVTAPPQAQFHRRPFLVGLLVGLPFELGGAPVNVPSSAGAVRVLHCPSAAEGKGTARIREAASALKSKGLAIDYVEISNRPNEEVLEEIGRCDFVVDQVFSDNPMAGFAAEAAFHGKAAVVGGYYSAFVRSDLPGDAIPPSLYCDPDEIEAGIEKLVTDVAFRHALGLRAKRFVEANWTAREVATRYLKLINGEYPERWVYDPSRNRYYLGMGLQASQCRRIVRSIVERYGAKGLMLEHNPTLERLLLEFAKGDECCAA